LLERDPVVFRVFRRSTKEIIFSFYSHWSLASRTASYAGSFSWTAMPLRLFIMISRFGIHRHFCGLKNSARRQRRTVLPQLVGGADISMGSKVRIWKKGTVHGILR
jgi:hypothetical protein